jgi:DNA-binding MurR/RpiR family transcriptional regulator
LTKSLRERLGDAAKSASKAERALANYMLAELASLPFETAASLATKVKLSEPTVGRFCRAIGYDGFKDLKKNLQNDMGDQPWLIGDRLRELQEQTIAGKDHLSRGLELEIAALVSVYETAQLPEWVLVVQRLATAQSVFVVGFQTERGIAQIFVHQLQYLRDKVQFVDLASGNFADVLATQNPDATLVIFEARRYSRHAKLLASEAKAAGIPVTLITDPYCDWGHSVADEVFVVPTSFNLFWESTAQMASLANLLVNSVFMELGPDVQDRMNKVAQLYGKFTGHADDTT